MPDIVEELRARAQQIRRDAEVAPHGRGGEDSQLLDRAANEIENLRVEIETLRED
jgi:DNA-directed RNA polymerase subunit K/omega